jgi:hypothetical protein
VIRVERDDDLLRAPLAVASRDQRADGPGIAAEHARADVQRVVVVGEAHFGVLDRRRTLVRLALREIRDRRSSVPDSFSKVSIDAR